MHIAVPLVSPCFRALVGCLLDVSKSLETKRATNASALTMQLLQRLMPHGEAQPLSHLLHSVSGAFWSANDFVFQP